LKMMGTLFLERYSRVEFKNPEAAMPLLVSIPGDPLKEALILTSRRRQTSTAPANQVSHTAAVAL
ncbi:hypothetical protein BGZ94_007456, partial [Podila epigama]